MLGEVKLHDPLCPGLEGLEGVYCGCPHVDCANRAALRIGRDAMSMRLRPFLERLVGAENADRIITRELVMGGFHPGRSG